MVDMNNTNIFKFVWRTGIGALTLCLASLAHGQEYPSKPIQIIVPFAPGGASDIHARLIGQKLSIAWKQPVIIENRAGAGGSIGAAIVAKAPRDGYTLLLTDVAAVTISPSLYPNLPYSAKDLHGVINLAVSGHILIAPTSFPPNTLSEVIALEKTKPGRLNIAISGIGSSTHISGLKLNALTGMNLTHVPYKGGGAAINDVIGGQVELMFIGPPPGDAFDQERQGESHCSDKRQTHGSAASDRNSGRSRLCRIRGS